MECSITPPNFKIKYDYKSNTWYCWNADYDFLFNDEPAIESDKDLIKFFGDV